MNHNERHARRQKIAEDGQKMGKVKAARKHRISPHRVYQCMREFECGVMTHKQRKERRLEAAAMLKAGTPPGEVCDTHKISVETLLLGCRESGVYVNLGNNHMTVRTFEILKQLLDGGEVIQVAIAYGVTRQRVSQIKEQARKAGFVFKGESK